MNKKQKFKKWFKENWTIITIFIVSLILTLSILIPKYVAKNTKVYENSITKRERIYTDTETLETLDLVNTFDIKITLNNNQEFNFHEELYYLEDISLHIVDNKYISLSPKLMVAQIIKDESGYWEEYQNYGVKYAYFSINIDIETTYIDYIEILTNDNIPLSIKYGNNQIDNAYFTNTNKEFFPRSYNVIGLNFDLYNFTNESNFIINFDRNADISNINTIYNQGREDMANEKQKEIDILQDNINELNQEITAKAQEIARLETQVTMLSKQIDDAKNGYSMADDLFEIADTPITMIQQILNFEILGINLWGFFSAIITIILAVWLIRKLI